MNNGDNLTINVIFLAMCMKEDDRYYFTLGFS
jgi:hypothetical protein